MRTNVQCLPEYQLDVVVAMVVVVVVVVMMVRRTWIGGKSNDPRMARSRAIKNRRGRGEERETKDEFSVGFCLVGRP